MIQILLVAATPDCLSELRSRIPAVTEAATITGLVAPDLEAAYRVAGRWFQVIAFCPSTPDQVRTYLQANLRGLGVA